MMTWGDVVKVANEAIGADSVRLVDYGFPHYAGLVCTAAGRFYILLDEWIPNEDRAFATAHELGEWMYFDPNDEDRWGTEEACNIFARGLLAGDLRPLRRAMRGHGGAHRDRARAIMAAVERLTAREAA